MPLFAENLALLLLFILIVILLICDHFIGGTVFQQVRYSQLAKVLPQKTFELFYMLSGQKYRTGMFVGSCVFLIVSLMASSTFFACVFVFKIYRDFIFVVVLLQGCIIFCVALGNFGIRKRFDKLVIQAKGISPEINLLNLDGRSIGNRRLCESVAFLNKSAQLDLTQSKINKKLLKEFYYFLFSFSQKLAIINPWGKGKLIAEASELRPDFLREIKKFDEILLDCKFEIKILRLCPHPIGNCRLTKSLGLDANI